MIKSTKNRNNYDVIVVGSGLISILKAVEEAKKGYEVCLIEQRDELGGAWSVHQIEGVGPIETACHLLEYYKGSYEKISEILNIKFERMEPQPDKVFASGVFRPYQSRFTLIIKPLRSILRYLFIIFSRYINFFLVKKFKIRKWSNEDLISLKKEVKFLFKYRFFGFLDFKGIQIPVGGYSRLPEKIIEAIQSNNITSIVGKKVTEIKMYSDNPTIIVDGKKITSSRVFISQSTSSKIVNFQSEPNKITNFKVFPHILVYVNSLKSNNFPYYIQVREDKDFRRVSFILNHYQNTNKGLFLIQTRKLMQDDPLIKEKITSLLFKCKLIDGGSQIQIKNYFNDFYVGNPNDSAFTPGNLSNSVICLETIGDISKIIALHH